MRHKLVEVKWTDAFSPRDKAWFEECDIQPILDSVSIPDYACGYMLRKTKKGILLAGQLSSNGCYGDLFFVPRGMVQRLRVLRGKHAK